MMATDKHGRCSSYALCALERVREERGKSLMGECFGLIKVDPICQNSNIIENRLIIFLNRIFLINWGNFLATSLIYLVEIKKLEIHTKIESNSEN